MPMTKLELFKHRLKNVARDVAFGSLFGAAVLAMLLMMVSHEFTKFFVGVGVIASIIWWIGSTIYWDIKLRKAKESRRIDAENQRKRWEAIEASVVVRSRTHQVLFDYDKQ